MRTNNFNFHYINFQLDILEYIHSHGYIHADIKASNLLLGCDAKDREIIYLLDYGLACRYIDNWGQHKEYNPDQRKAHDGTLEYTSRDAHVGGNIAFKQLKNLFCSLKMNIIYCQAVSNLIKFCTNGKQPGKVICTINFVGCKIFLMLGDYHC